MKQKLLFLLLAMMATVSYADNFYNEIDIGDYTYNLTLRTSGENTAVMIDLSSAGESLERLEIPGYVDYNGNKYRVDKIGYMAVANNNKIQRVDVDYGVTEIGKDAFNACTKLKTVTLPSSIKKIGEKAFYDCTALIRLSFAGNVPPTISANTFGNTGSSKTCYAATYRGANALKAKSDWAAAFSTIERDVDNYYAYDFKKEGIAYMVKDGIPYTNTSKCIMVGGNPPEGGVLTLRQFVDAPTMINPPGNYMLEAVTDSAFIGNTNIIAIANNYTLAQKIGERAFANCSNLIQAFLAVDSIMIDAFQNCTKLTTLKLYKGNESGAGPNSVVYIGNYAFTNTGLTTVNIPSSCRKVGLAPFYWCRNMTSITVDSDNENYAGFNGCLYSKDYTHLVEVPAAWTYVDTQYGFDGHLIFIDEYAAAGNYKIVNLTLPYGVRTVGARSFEDCSSIMKVRLPSSVTTLSPYAFRGCTNVTYFYANMPSPLYLPTYLFTSSRAAEIKLYVPHDSFSAYKSANYWSYFNLQTGELDHLEVWDFKDSDDYYWTVIDNNAHYTANNDYVNGNARLVRGKTTTTLPVSFIGISYRCYEPVEIGRSAFEGLSAPISMTVSNGDPIKRIKERAFYGTSLKNFTFTNVEEIGDSAFMNTTNLSISLSLNNLKTVGMRAFSNSSIKSLTTGAALNSIGKYAFADSKSLATVEINPSSPLTVIPEGAFYNCTALKSCTLSRNISLIDAYGFYQADLSSMFIFPTALKTIGKFAFYNTKLTDIELPYGFTSVEEEGLSCKASRIVFPATITSIHYKFDQQAFQNLYELVVNSKTPPTIKNGVSGFNTSSLPRSAGCLYVPIECIPTYRSKWTQYGGDHHISEGGYDFTNIKDGLKYTVTLPASGNTIGTCEMVYNPNVLNTAVSVTAGDAKSDLYDRIYNCTAIGDKCFAGSTSIRSIYITPTLKTIGNFAFMNSSLQTSYESMSGGGSSGYIPVTVTRIGQFAFDGCKNLHELFLPHIDRKHTLSVGQGFFGNNANDFKCWVDYRRLGDFVVDNNGMWDANRVYPHLKLDSEWQSFSCVKNIDFNNTLVESYVVSSYDKSQNMAQLNTVLQLPAGVGAIVHGQDDGTYYRLGYPANSPSASSMMESVTTGSKEVSSNNALSYFVLYYKAPVFNKISIATFHRGYAYLKLNTSLVGSSTSQVVTNISGPGGGGGGGALKGDVNCDGSVNAADVTALYRYILNGDMTYFSTSDVNDDNSVNAADVTAVYMIIMGNN